MADTLDPVDINDQWQSLNTLTGIAVGAPIKIQNVGAQNCFVRLSAVQPTEEYGEGCYVARFYGVASGESEVWAKTQAKGTESRLSVQEDA